MKTCASSTIVTESPAPTSPPPSGKVNDWAGTDAAPIVIAAAAAIMIVRI
jgi:hypothetical protein